MVLMSSGQKRYGFLVPFLDGALILADSCEVVGVAFEELLVEL